MAIYKCPKWERGELKFQVDWINQKLALQKDFPVDTNGTGAWFSQNWWSFDEINEKLATGIDSGSFMNHNNKRHTINTSTMLCAVLLSLGCIDRNYSTIRPLSPTIQSEYDQKNPPVQL